MPAILCYCSSKVKKSLLFAGQSPLIQTLCLLALLCVLGVAQIITQSAVWDPDIWWHLRTGQWIIHHHSVPHVGLFSRTGASTPWAAYSWGFEIVVAALNLWFGLKALPIFVMVFGAIFTLLLFSVLRSLSNRFWLAWLLTGACLWGMNPTHVAAPRPVNFTYLFFTIGLWLVLKSLEKNDRRYLYWLPLVFAIWANFHIQFVYGLLIPGLLAFVVTLSRWPRLRRMAPWLEVEGAEGFSLGLLWVLVLACVAATLVNPYGIGLYRTILIYVRSSYPYQVIMELQAVSFRESGHYVELLLVAAGFFVLGRRKPNFFHFLLLTIATLVAFRTQRDAWFLCIVASSLMAWHSRTIPETASSEEVAAVRGVGIRGLGAALAGAILVMALRTWDSGMTSDNLLKTVRNSYPVGAVEFIQQQHPPGPLFNNFNWGGFLIGVLPEYPVSIDGRNDLYGDAFLYRELHTLVSPDWADDPALRNANLVLLPKDLPLSNELRRSPQFDLAYSDDVAVVFVRNGKDQQSSLR